VWATSLEVFLHRDFGERYLGLNSLGVLLLVPLYTAFWSPHDPRPMMCFLPAFLLMCVVARLGMAKRRFGGLQGHSLYNGWPRFLGAKAKVSERSMKLLHEPLIAGVVGWAVRDSYNAPLGTYLMIGGFCLFVSASINEAAARAQAMDLNDAEIDQRMTAERFRGMHGDVD
jgi:hypothetical protein